MSTFLSRGLGLGYCLNGLWKPFSVWIHFWHQQVIDRLNTLKSKPLIQARNLIMSSIFTECSFWMSKPSRERFFISLTPVQNWSMYSDFLQLFLNCTEVTGRKFSSILPRKCTWEQYGHCTQPHHINSNSFFSNIAWTSITLKDWLLIKQIFKNNSVVCGKDKKNPFIKDCYLLHL